LERAEANADGRRLESGVQGLDERFDVFAPVESTAVGIPRRSRKSENRSAASAFDWTVLGERLAARSDRCQDGSNAGVSMANVSVCISSRLSWSMRVLRRGAFAELDEQMCDLIVGATLRAQFLDDQDCPHDRLAL
jgi:hypothetical protein